MSESGEEGAVTPAETVATACVRSAVPRSVMAWAPAPEVFDAAAAESKAAVHPILALLAGSAGIRTPPLAAW